MALIRGLIPSDSPITPQPPLRRADLFFFGFEHFAAHEEVAAF